MIWCPFAVCLCLFDGLGCLMGLFVPVLMWVWVRGWLVLTCCLWSYGFVIDLMLRRLFSV